MELQGRIIKVLQMQCGTSQQGNPWRKQEYIFGYYENPSDIYERKFKIELMNDNIDKYKLEENDQIKVRVALTCREYPKDSGKYFNDIRTGDITIIKKANSNAQQAAQPENNQQANNQPETQNQAPQGAQNEGGKDDDLPF